MANQNEQRGGAGNVTNDPKRASEMGKKGGEHAGSRQHEQSQGADKRQQGSQTRDGGKDGAGAKGGQR